MIKSRSVYAITIHPEKSITDGIETLIQKNDPVTRRKTFVIGQFAEGFIDRSELFLALAL